MKEKILKAYFLCSFGYSPDRVIADPELNVEFIKQCRRQGLKQLDEQLNRSLLNFRKAGDLKGSKRSKKTSFKDMHDYQFASEIAARILERREQVSLDVILCRPGLVVQFDRLAEMISPGFTPLKYRWAALNLRKNKRLRPELLSRVIAPTEVKSFKVGSVELKSQVPNQPGLYVFFSRSQPLYAGETDNLLKRMEKHLDHSDNKGLARWLWEFKNEDIFLEVQVLPKGVATRVRKAMEMELIRSRNPLFNISR